MRLGLIGAGVVGQIRVQAIGNIADCELVAVADVDLERAKQIAPSPQTAIYTDYQQMLASGDVDGVVVSTPPQYHEEIVLAALEADKHVLCEKPLANTVVGSRRMVEAANRAGKVLATGFNHRFFPAIQFVKQTLDSGVLGELDHVRSFAGHVGLSEFRAAWEYDKDVVGGGALMDNGVHLIDLTRYILGEVAEVYGAATHNVWKLNSEDNGFGLLRRADGKTATLHASWSEWKGYHFHVEAYGTKGMARASYAPMMSSAVWTDSVTGKARKRRNFYPMTILREKLHGWTWTAEKTFRNDIEGFVLKARGEPSESADGFSGFRAVEIANAIYCSSEERRPITLAEPF